MHQTAKPEEDGINKIEGGGSSTVSKEKDDRRTQIQTIATRHAKSNFDF